MTACMQFVAPDGFQEMRKGQRYYRIRQGVSDGRVCLVELGDKPSQVEFVVVGNEDFQRAMRASEIIYAPEQASLPPWLSSYEGLDMEVIDSLRNGTKRTLRETAEEREASLQPLLSELVGIFRERDVTIAVNRRLRAELPRKNTCRLRKWFFTYLACGQNLWSLLPPYCNLGRWERPECPERKAGRPVSDTSRGGFAASAAMREEILRGFLKYSKRNAKKCDVYRIVLSQQFGCTFRNTSNGKLEPYHPQGLPYPSERQFWYYVSKAFSRTELGRARLGPQRHRNQLEASLGAYHQELTNFLEKVEADASTVHEYPRGIHGNYPLPRLYVVRMVDIASSMVVGVGFSLASEVAQAYRSAMFCAAIDKVRYCALFGLEISKDDWPTSGLPSTYIPDRGPGSAEIVTKPLFEYSGCVELPPSYTPQSHGTVEASHPRETVRQGAPEYTVSKMTVAELMRREIIQVIKKNKSGDARARLTPEMMACGTSGTPLSIWRFLHDAGRDDSNPISFEAAARDFLQKTRFQVIRGGLKLEGLAYSSEQLKGTFQPGPKYELDGFILPFCIGTAWVQIHARLYEVNVQFALQSPSDSRCISLAELTICKDIDRAQGRERRENELGAALEAIESQLKYTGCLPNAGTTRRGRAKHRSEQAKLDVSHLKIGKGGSKL